MPFVVIWMTERLDFTEDEINAVWDKDSKQQSNNPDVFRKDYAGAWIRRDDYVKRDKPYGWEIDHFKPLKKIGTYDIDNLYSFHWKNIEKNGGDYTYWKTAVTSRDIKNIESEQKWVLDE